MTQTESVLPRGMTLAVAIIFAAAAGFGIGRVTADSTHVHQHTGYWDCPTQIYTKHYHYPCILRTK